MRIRNTGSGVIFRIEESNWGSCSGKKNQTKGVRAMFRKKKLNWTDCHVLYKRVKRSVLFRIDRQKSQTECPVKDRQAEESNNWVSCSGYTGRRVKLSVLLRIDRQKSHEDIQAEESNWVWMFRKKESNWVSCSGQKSQSELDFDKIGRVVEVKMGMASLTTCRKNRYPT